MPNPATDTLNSGDVVFTALEASTSKLWNEFVRAWFSGATHVLTTLDGANVSLAFPQVADVAFQQSAIKQPLEGLGFGIVMISDPKTMHRRVSVAGARQQLRITWRFYIRAKVSQAAATGENSESLCRRASDCFTALMAVEKCHAPLRAKGISNIRAQPGMMVPTAEHTTRVTNVSATVLIQSGVATTP